MNEDETSPQGENPEQVAPWLCHVCGESFHTERGTACACCYQLACQEHLELVVVANPTYGQPELKPACSVCRNSLEEVSPDRDH